MMMIVMTIKIFVGQLAYYKNQSHCEKFSKLITNGSKEANPEKSRKISKRSRDENIRLIPSLKIPGSRDFAKSRPVPSRIEIPENAGA